MNADILLKQIEFIKEIDKIKYIERKTKLFNSDRRENDAEHSWHLAMMALVLAEHANEDIDILKVIKMVLIHDIVEIDSGDIFFYDADNGHNNTEAELKAAKRIFGILPAEQAEELINIWLEFEDAETAEARFAKSLDRFEPLLQNYSNKGGTWQEFDVSHDMVYGMKRIIKDGSSSIWQYAEKFINDSVDQGYLKRD
ncbi:MAG: HD domain-containing protein [Proteiniphilum sp.]|nr:HD domain-containing protein [Proteiniphilum sp.]